MGVLCGAAAGVIAAGGGNVRCVHTSRAYTPPRLASYSPHSSHYVTEQTATLADLVVRDPIILTTLQKNKENLSTDFIL